MSLELSPLEKRLNDFDAGVRDSILGELRASAACEGFHPAQISDVNLHFHTFFSYNGYGWSPSCIAWKAWRAGLYAASIVDFDVLDAADEFLNACNLLGLRGAAGLETRVFVPQFATREMNSPGEPGVAYHMGVGFSSSTVKDKEFLGSLKEIARNRNLSVVGRVNPFLSPVEVDYDSDVLPLTPNGNATERHLCAAYDNKAKQVLPDPAARTAFWAEKLATPAEKIAPILDDPAALQGLIRAKTMKSGGVGYVKPMGTDFPELERVNAFVLGEGAIPTFAYLDGTTAGEQCLEELLDVMQASGVAAVNIIPDRNWRIKDPEQKRIKVENFHRFVAEAQSRDLPILAGTEMNAPGQLFVDDFSAPEMAPLVQPAIDGASLLYAHTLLQPRGMGYLSDWAAKSFDSTRAKNRFFAELGEKAMPALSDRLAGANTALAPAEVLAFVSA